MPSPLPRDQLPSPSSRTPDAVWDLAEIQAVVLGARAALLICFFTGSHDAVAWHGLSLDEALSLAHLLPSRADLSAPVSRLEPIPDAPALAAAGEAVQSWVSHPVQGADGTPYGWAILLFTGPRTWTEADVSLHERLNRQIGAQIDLFLGWRRMSAELHELKVYRQYFDEGPDLLVRLGPGLSSAALSRSWERALGHSLDEMYKAGLDLVHPEDRAGVEAGLHRLSALGPVALGPFQQRMLHKDGRWRALSVLSVRVEDTIIGSARDVTAERASSDTLAAIAEAQRRFIQGAKASHVVQALLDGLKAITESPFGVIGAVERDPDGAVVVRISDVAEPVLEALTCAQRDPATGEVWLRHPDSMVVRMASRTEPLILNGLDRGPNAQWTPGKIPPIQSFMGMPVRIGGQTVGVACLGNRPGGYRPEDVDTLRPLLDSAAVLLQAINADQQRRASVDALRESEARFRGVFETAHEAKLLVRLDGTIEVANPAAGRLLGCPCAELADADLRTLIAPARRARAAEGFLGRAWDRFRQAPGHTETTQGVRKDGTVFPVEFSLSLLDLKEPRYAVVLRDLTERQRIERLKSEFVATVSHELRTPLTAIRGSLGLLAQQQINLDAEERGELVQLAVRNADRLHVLVGDILDMEKVTSGKLDFTLERVSLVALVKDSMRSNAVYAALHSCSLRLVLPLDDGLVLADATRLGQVLDNLISNAVKHSPTGAHVELSVEGNDHWLRVAVRDHGPGVPAHFRDRIFLPFSQADGSNTRAQGGTGLGLSISRAIMEELAGRLGFDDAPDGGASFWFELPRYSISETQTASV